MVGASLSQQHHIRSLGDDHAFSLEWSMHSRRACLHRARMPCLICAISREKLLLKLVFFVVENLKRLEFKRSIVIIIKRLKFTNQ